MLRRIFYIQYLTEKLILSQSKKKYNFACRTLYLATFTRSFLLFFFSLGFSVECAPSAYDMIISLDF